MLGNTKPLIKGMVKRRRKSLSYLDPNKTEINYLLLTKLGIGFCSSCWFLSGGFGLLWSAEAIVDEYGSCGVGSCSAEECERGY